MRRWQQHPGEHRRRRRRKKGDPDEPADHGLGRSRGGYGSKIHLICDAKGVPIDVRVTGGQTQECTQLPELLMDAAETLSDSGGPPRAWPVRLAGDRGYRSNKIDRFLRDQEIRPVIPDMRHQVPGRRAVAFDACWYKRRNIVERVFGWLKRCRRVGTRYEKTLLNFIAVIKLAIIRRLLGVRLPAKK